MPSSLDDIFADDDFGLLNAKPQPAASKTEDDRLIDAFEEINAFVEKAGREPASGSMSEYNLLARLKSFRDDEAKKRILKPFDRLNLLGQVEMPQPTLDEVLNEDDFGLLENRGDASIFDFRHTPKTASRAKADTIAQREPIPEKEFRKYEPLFQQVHRELKEGKRKFADFVNVEKNLQVGQYYLLGGMLLLLEAADLKQGLRGKNTGGRVQLDGRTNTIFENGTRSTMLFRSLGKAIQKEGRLVTALDWMPEPEPVPDVRVVSEDAVPSGWVYILKTKSQHPHLMALSNLYKIGFSTVPVAERIKNAAKEATYLFAEVELVASYTCYDTNIKHLEKLLHRFFASACVNVDVFDPSGTRITPREWFCVPFGEIDTAIKLLLSGEIIHYRYNMEEARILPRQVRPF